MATKPTPRPKAPMPMPRMPGMPPVSKMPRRFFDLGAALAAILVAVFALLSLSGCFPGADPHAVIQTSTGPREAGTVWTQDVVGDVLDFLSQAQLSAVRQYQRVPLEQRDPAWRLRLLSSQAAIRAGYDGLIAWKQLPSGGGPDLVLNAIRPFAADVLDLLEHSGALSPAAVAKARAFLAPLLGGTP